MLLEINNGHALSGVPAMPVGLRRSADDVNLVHGEADLMSDAATHEALVRENAYLKTRVAQLQDDLTMISAEAERYRQVVERLHGRTVQSSPNPLGSGQ
jgi:hypothetical protein